MLYAEFLGMQDDGQGNSFPLFNIKDFEEKHPLHKSTVGAKTLTDLKITTIFYPKANEPSSNGEGVPNVDHTPSIR